MATAFLLSNRSFLSSALAAVSSQGILAWESGFFKVLVERDSQVALLVLSKQRLIHQSLMQL